MSAAAFLTMLCLGLLTAAYATGLKRATALEHLEQRYTGFVVRLCVLGTFISLLIATVLALAVTDSVVVAVVLVGFAGLIGLASCLRFGRTATQARWMYERLVITLMGLIASIAVITTLGIFLTLIFESSLFFQKVPWTQFLFGPAWNPQMALREDQVGMSGAFGLLPLLSGTFLVTLIAMVIAVPVGLMSAICLETYVAPKFRDGLKLMLELLAGVPTVVYGFFALLFVGPLISSAASAGAALLGIERYVPIQNALSAGIVMGIMIIPFISSLSDDVMAAIPAVLKEGALAMGATKSEVVLKVLLPAAAPGLIGAFLLAMSRAVGETMIVVMAASRSANLTLDPLERITTLTVQIVALLTGDQSFDSPKTLAAFALGLTLFLITLGLNVVALITVKRFHLRYE